MRLFIALPLPPEIETELGRYIAELKKCNGNIKWVKPENIHLTLKFLGETDESNLPALSDIISETANEHKIIKTALETIAAFPNLRRPRVIFTTLDSGSEPMTLLAEQIDQAVSKLGFKRESRPFKPHLTLGRVKNSLGLEKTIDAIPKIRVNKSGFACDQIVLYQSTLTPQGAIYDKLHRAKLGEPRFGD
jgi:2'-5' RNA ligase